MCVKVAATTSTQTSASKSLRNSGWLKTRLKRIFHRAGEQAAKQNGIAVLIDSENSDGAAVRPVHVEVLPDGAGDKQRDQERDAKRRAEEEEQERPDEIKLLLDRKTPVVGRINSARQSGVGHMKVTEEQERR